MKGSISNKMNTNINYLLEEVKRKRLIFSRFFTEFPIGGLGKPKLYHDLGVFYKEVGRFPQRTQNMRNIILLTDIVSAYTEILRKY